MYYVIRRGNYAARFLDLNGADYWTDSMPNATRFPDHAEAFRAAAQYGGYAVKF